MHGGDQSCPSSGQVRNHGERSCTPGRYDLEMANPSCLVFFSHSTADREWVLHLSHQAKAAGVEVYLAEHDVKAGERLSEKVTQAIEASDAVIVLLSKNSLNSIYVQQEVGVAQHASKMVIPILMHEVAGDDLGMLNGIEYIQLDPADPVDALARLTATLNNLLELQRNKVRVAAMNQSRDEMLLLGGALLIIIGLMIITNQSEQ